MEDVGRKFEAAWDVFAATCSETLVNEPTYQVWFAHYLISQFGIDRIVREADFGPSRFLSRHREIFDGSTSVRVDAVVAREPGISVPHRAMRRRAQPTDTTLVDQIADPDGGAAILADIAVLSELKVSATQGEGLAYAEVVRDFRKLSLLLDEADRRGVEAPLAYACILDNGKGRRSTREPSFNWRHLRGLLEGLDIDPRVRVLGAPDDFAVPINQGRETGLVTFDEVWSRVVAHEGETFTQKRGGEFTYQVDGNGIALSRTNQRLARSHIEEAWLLTPLADTTAVQHLRAPSYLYALLSDERIRMNDW